MNLKNGVKSGRGQYFNLIDIVKILETPQETIASESE